MRGVTVAAIVALGFVSPALAQSGSEIAAYKKGFADGYARCQTTPGCAWPGGTGWAGWTPSGTMAAPGSSGGSYTGDDTPGGPGAPGTKGYELPDAFFTGVDEEIEIPQNWYVTRTNSGNGLLGRVDDQGRFSPYVFRPDGSLDLLSPAERPQWTANPIISNKIDALPKVEGLTIVPIQPIQIQ